MAAQGQTWAELGLEHTETEARLDFCSFSSPCELEDTGGDSLARLHFHREPLGLACPVLQTTDKIPGEACPPGAVRTQPDPRPRAFNVRSLLLPEEPAAPMLQGARPVALCGRRFQLRLHLNGCDGFFMLADNDTE